MLKVGFPKGDAIGKSRQVISNYFDREIGNEILHYFDEKKHIHFYLLKPRDIPKLVHDGHLDAGITSEEWIVEKDYQLQVHKKLDWCNTRVSLLTPHEQEPIKSGQSITCVTEFPNIASQFFQRKGIQEYTIEHVSGSCEGLVPSVYDCAVDCVETGASARRHGLKEEATILHSQVVLVTKTRTVSPRLQEAIESLAL